MEGPDGSDRDRIDWKPLMDGRLRRLKRGVHYTGSVHVLAREAKAAAEELGRTGIVYKDLMGKFEYLWVQFLDGRVEVGQRCPRCRAGALEQVQEFFARCASCGAMHVLAEASSPTLGADGQARPLIDVVMARLVSAAGEPVEQIDVLDEAVVELSCHFSRPVWVRQVLLTFFLDGGKLFRAGCSKDISVDRPQTVDYTLHVEPGLLVPGSYELFTSVHVRESEGSPQIKFDHPEALLFEVHDRRARAEAGGAAPERPHLDWEVEVLPEPAEVAGA